MAVKKTIELELGQQGPHILEAQIMLAKLGSTVKPTGMFTIGMLSAVKAFQKKNDLAVTGIINQKTWNLLVAKTNVVKRTATKKKGAGKK